MMVRLHTAVEYNEKQKKTTTSNTNLELQNILDDFLYARGVEKRNYVSPRDIPTTKVTTNRPTKGIVTSKSSSTGNHHGKYSASRKVTSVLATAATPRWTKKVDVSTRKLSSSAKQRKNYSALVAALNAALGATNETVTHSASNITTTKTPGDGLISDLIGFSHPTIYFAIVAGVLLAMGIAVCIYDIIDRIRNPRIIKHRSNVPSDGPTEKDMLDYEQNADFASNYGEIFFNLQFKVKTLKLTVTINNCVGLAGDDARLTPYVRVSLVPPLDTKKKVRKTRVKQGVDPIFNDAFVFQFKSPHDFKDRSILLEIYDEDPIMVDSQIGKCSILMTEDIINDCSLQAKDMEMRIGQPSEIYEGVGDICIGLRRNAKKQRLQVHILEVKNANLPRNQKLEPNIMIHLNYYFGNTLKKSKTTPRKMANRNPYFDERYFFPMPETEAANVKLYVKVVHVGKLAIETTVGKVKFKKDQENIGVAMHWKAALQTPGTSFYRWHQLQLGGD